MPQSLSGVYLHLVFSTKDRRPYLRDPRLRAEMQAMLGGISGRLDCPSIQVGGVEDHVHLLCRFGRTITQSEWVKELKRVSTKWLKAKEPSLSDFGWQNGYATFSVSASQRDRVMSYIRDQEVHHNNSGFQDELRVLLARYQMAWDERFLWD
ncbi:MAG: IS200/IS605 family transposase [Verrucomicrobiales bacterium]|nr:IS200/IS605 family transposase [Verrucomicrobiales bacterium]